MAEKKQTMRYTDDELKLIKDVFVDNDDLAKAIRKVFLQMPLDPIDEASLTRIKHKSIQDLLRKTFLPTLDGNAPVHQPIDLWMTLEIKGKTPEQLFPDVLARGILIEYLDQQLKVLGGDNTNVAIEFNKFVEIEKKAPIEIYCNLAVRNTIIAHIEMMLGQLLILAGTKDETPEQTMERLKKDSTK